MSHLVHDCPRCGSAKITFDIKAAHYTRKTHTWSKNFETFCVCRHCDRTTVFVVSEKEPDVVNKLSDLVSRGSSVNDIVSVDGFISQKDASAEAPPEYLPEALNKAFTEGATCLAVGCANAAATMFRLCVDHATSARLPVEDVHGLTIHIRRTLGLRLKWLFDNGILPEDLRELSHCIKEDGNDGAHAGTLQEADALDLLDFTRAMLERLYTEPAKVKIANERRAARRAK